MKAWLTFDAGAAAVAAALALGVYLASCGSAPANWDFAEAQTVPYILGIFHPTGFPAYALAGWLFTHLVPFGTVAWRMNALSSIAMAVTVAALYATARTLGSQRLAAFGASLTFAFGATIWSKACHSDVHAFNLALCGLTVLCGSRAVGSGDARMAKATGFFFGCGLATHPTTLWLAPVVVAALFAIRRTPRSVAAGVLLIALPLLSYGYLPIRSAIVVAQGLDPLAAPPFNGRGEIAWNTNDPRTWDGFVREVSGSQFDASSRLAAIVDVGAYARSSAAWQRALLAEYGRWWWLLAAALLVAMARRSDPRPLILLAASFGAICFAVAYAAVESDVTRYYLPSFFMLCAAATSVTADLRGNAARTAATAFGAVLLVAALSNFRDHADAFRFRSDVGSRATIDLALASIPDGAIVVTDWVDATSLAYAAFVDHALGNRLVVAGWASDFADVYPAWRRSRPIFVLATPEQLEMVHRLPARWIASDQLADDGRHHIIEIVPPRLTPPR